MKKNKSCILPVLLILVLSGCKNNQDKDNSEYPYIINVKKLEGKNTVEEKLSRQLMKNKTTFPGVIEIPQQSIYTVSFPYSGTIKKVFVQPGDTIKKGQPIATVQSAELIKLQQEYLEKKYQLEYYKHDFERQGELTLEKATSVKKMEKAQSDYLVLNAKVKGLEPRLRIAGINPEKCNTENIISQIYISAPANGLITELSIHTGKFINSQNILAEINEIGDFNIVITIPKSDFYTLYNITDIQFYTEISTSNIFDAKILSKHVDPENSEQIKVRAKIANPDELIQPGFRVKAFVSSQNDSVWAVPVSSIIWQNDNANIYIRSDNNYVKTKVITGKISNDYIEIKNVFDLPDNPVILKDVENLYNF